MHSKETVYLFMLNIHIASHMHEKTLKMQMDTYSRNVTYSMHFSVYQCVYMLCIF